MKSEFGFYSVGVVAFDKEVGSNIIEVYPQEYLSEYEGVITTDNWDDINVDKVKYTEGLYETSLTYTEKEMKHEATWVNLGSTNRVSAPDVKKGETVLLYKFGDANKIYWSTYKYETDLRRKETVVYLYGNTDEHGKTLDFNNTYYIVVDTKNKNIKLHTSNNDGEVVAFDIIINTKEGSITTKDSNGNYLKHDGKNGNLSAAFSESINLKAPNIILDGEVKVTKQISDEKGNITTHTHSTTDGATALSR